MRRLPAQPLKYVRGWDKALLVGVLVLCAAIVVGVGVVIYLHIKG
jgi:hypothetical protein